MIHKKRTRKGEQNILRYVKIFLRSGEMMDVLRKDMAACQVGEAPDTWKDYFLEQVEPLSLGRLGDSEGVCYFQARKVGDSNEVFHFPKPPLPVEGPVVVLSMERVKNLINNSSSPLCNQYEFKTIKLKEIWDTYYKRLNPSPSKTSQRVERLMPRLFALPAMAEKAFYFFKRSICPNPEYFSLECKRIVNNVTVYHFERLAIQVCNPFVYKGNLPRECFKGSVRVFLEKYMKQSDTKWDKWRCIDPVVLSCRVTFAVVDTIGSDKVYKVATKVFRFLRIYFRAI